MPVHIDPGFSVFELTQRIQDQSSILNHRQTMNLISYEIENATLKDGARTRIFSSFQRMSRFIPQIPRYQKLAQTAESIYVFGIPDVIPPSIPNITYIDLKPTDRLAREWFLVSYGKDFASALATEELTHIDDPDTSRMFKGIWTFDAGLTSILEEWLTRTVDAEPLYIDEAAQDGRRIAQYINNIHNRLLKQYEQKMQVDRKTTIQKELHAIVKDNVYRLPV